MRVWVLPTADGGKVVWAVFEAPRLRPSTGNEMGNSRVAQVKSPGIAKTI